MDIGEVEDLDSAERCREPPGRTPTDLLGPNNLSPRFLLYTFLAQVLSREIKQSPVAGKTRLDNLSALHSFLPCETIPPHSAISGVGSLGDTLGHLC